jgi:hypothetical protein
MKLYARRSLLTEVIEMVAVAIILGLLVAGR